MKERKIDMRRYYYSVKNSSKKRGMNREVGVYIQRKNGYFKQIGETIYANTASYEGDIPSVIKLIKEITDDELAYKDPIQLP